MTKVWKIIMELLLVLLLVLLYEKRVISLSFHEISGLILLGFLLFHVLLNRRWVTGVTKGLLHSSLPTKIKIQYGVNVLLVLCWFLVGLSGILISKIVFHFSVPGPWKVIHYTSAATALILIGIHIGLHWTLIRNICGKWFQWLGKIAQPLGAVCLAGLLIFGLYSMVTTDFTRWLTMPFTMSEKPQNHWAPGQSQALAGEIDSPQQRGRHGQGQGLRDGTGPRTGGKVQEAFSFAQLLKVMANYLSILSVFATITYLLFRSRKGQIVV